ncbi:MAG: hypothetical protein ACR2LU_06555 [Luteitalea sp.]
MRALGRSLPVVQVRAIPFAGPAPGVPLLYDRVWIHRRAAG